MDVAPPRDDLGQDSRRACVDLAREVLGAAARATTRSRMRLPLRAASLRSESEAWEPGSLEPRNPNLGTSTSNPGSSQRLLEDVPDGEFYVRTVGESHLELGEQSFLGCWRPTRILKPAADVAAVVPIRDDERRAATEIAPATACVESESSRRTRCSRRRAWCRRRGRAPRSAETSADRSAAWSRRVRRSRTDRDRR